MLEDSDRLEFETAALLRDQINAITKVTAGQKVVVDPEEGRCLKFLSLIHIYLPGRKGRGIGADVFGIVLLLLQPEG